MENQYYRTFIGLPVSVERSVLNARAELMQLLGGERISWVDPKRYHITLRFLGDTPLPEVGEIGRALHEGLDLPGKWNVPMSGAGSFGPRKYPRVIWVGFEDSTMFDYLKGEVDRVLQTCGIPPAEEPFRPHLTLGRIRDMKDLEGYYGSIGKMQDKFNQCVQFDSLVFYRSEMGKGEPVYTSLLELEFG